MKLPKVANILFFNESRKVGVGLWLFITSHILLVFKYITSGDWLAAVMASVALVGGGTVLDTWLKKKNDPGVPSLES